MAPPSQPEEMSLFNDPILSDIKIRQIYKGETKEYFAHKAILSAHSKWFMRAFTGRFKEATANVIDIHDDDPDHFERMLRFFYTTGHKLGPVCIFSGNTKDEPTEEDFQKHLLAPIKLYALADKYDAPALCDHVTETWRQNLEAAWVDSTQLCSIIRTHYETCITVDDPMSGVITWYIVDRCMRWLGTTVEAALMAREHPTFSVDIFLALQAKSKIVLPK
ncbi:hypothetical protein J4E89_005250 [Alternaria sp. Ai002NY15]|nr:hypothetical protein J4E89_005250 [Alternaria sp. Ai002NY15]